MANTPATTASRIPVPGVYALPISIDAALIADGKVLTDLVLGHPFRILDIKAITSVAITTAAKASTITAYIDDVSTGAAVTVSGAKAIGIVTEGVGPTNDIEGSATGKLTLTASATTTFVEGRLTLVVMIRNLDCS